MAQFTVVDMNGKKVSTVELSDAVFGITPNEKAVHEAVVNFLANQRQGTQNTKIRKEVRGGGKKPWRQKGTGRARAGYAGSPVWRHGGVAFAPKPRDYRYSLTKKTRRLALKSALSDKANEECILVVDGLHVDTIKTKPFAEFLEMIGATGKAMVITENVDEAVLKSARNIPGVTVTTATIISAYEILNNRVLVVDKAALQKIEEVFA